MNSRRRQNLTPNQSPTINQDINGEDITPKLKDVPPTPKPSLSMQQGGKTLPKKQKTNLKITSWINPKPIIVMTNIKCTRFWRPTADPNSETARAKLPQAARVRRERGDVVEVQACGGSSIVSMNNYRV